MWEEIECNSIFTWTSKDSPFLYVPLNSDVLCHKVDCVLNCLVMLTYDTVAERKGYALIIFWYTVKWKEKKCLLKQCSLQAFRITCQMINH